MKSTLVLTLALGLVLAGVAAAKGPTRATITGPGLSQPIVLNGNPESNLSSQFGQLVEQGGWFPEVFQQTPDSTSRVRPPGNLGPRYEVVYHVPDGSAAGATIRQSLYPYAAGGPVTHVRPGQPLFGTTAHGGWYRAPLTLRRTLVSLGLPRRAPALSRSSLGAGAWAGIALGIALAIAGAATLAARSRRQPGGAAA